MALGQSGGPTLYSPLSNPSRQIRLVQLDRSNIAEADALLKCTLSTFHLNQRPTYRALSYVWGDATETLCIVVDDIVVRHTTSLVTALHHLRTDDEVDFIWIDALCINQADTNEKNYQVPLMGTIYSGAELVIAWLGRGDESVCKAFETMRIWSDAIENTAAVPQQTVASRNSTLGEHSSHTAASTTARYDPREETNLERKLYRWTTQNRKLDLKATMLKLFSAINDPFSPVAWESVGSLARFSYWGRIWIVQEITLAKELRLTCAMASIDESTFFRAITCWEKMLMEVGLESSTFPSGYEDFFLPNISHLMAELSIILTMRREQHWKTPHEVVGAASSAHATDPRDMIFGVMNLVKCDTPWVRPDYSCSTATVYTNFIKSELQRTNDLSVIYFLGCKLDKRVTPDLPTWVPDLYADCLRSYTFPFQRVCHDYRCHWEISENLEDLTARGLRCDTVIFADHLLEKPIGSQHASIADVFLRWMTLARRHVSDSGPAGVTALSALFRAIIRAQKDGSAKEHGGSPLPIHDLDRDSLHMVHSLFLSLTALRRWHWPFPDSSAKFWSEHFPGLYDVTPTSSGIYMYDRTYALAGMPNLSRYMKGAFENETFFMTTKGYIGLAREVRAGDLICDLTGTCAPAILRPQEEHFLLLGDCYVYGLMDGQMTRDATQSERWEEGTASEDSKDHGTGNTGLGDADTKRQKTVFDLPVSFEYFHIR